MILFDIGVLLEEQDIMEVNNMQVQTMDPKSLLAKIFDGSQSPNQRNKIIKFDGCYHGHVDSLLIKAGSGVSTFGLPDSPGIPEDLAKHTITCPYNNIEAFIEIFNSVKDDLASVIVEPIAGNMGFVPGTLEFLQTIQSTEIPTILILINGFIG